MHAFDAKGMAGAKATRCRANYWIWSTLGEAVAARREQWGYCGSSKK